MRCKPRSDAADQVLLLRYPPANARYAGLLILEKTQKRSMYLIVPHWQVSGGKAIFRRRTLPKHDDKSEHGSSVTIRIFINTRC